MSLFSIQKELKSSITFIIFLYKAITSAIMTVQCFSNAFKNLKRNVLHLSITLPNLKHKISWPALSVNVKNLLLMTINSVYLTRFRNPSGLLQFSIPRHCHQDPHSIHKFHIRLSKMLINLQAPRFLYIGQAFRYSPENAFYIFNQQIYFIILYLLDRAALI